MKQTFFDSHVHSNNSPDASPDTVEQLARSAREKGLLGLCVTDHCDVNCYDRWGCGDCIAGSTRDLAAAKERFCTGDFFLGAGIELGQPLQALDKVELAMAMGPYDFVLGSLHNGDRYQDYHFIDFRTSPLDPWEVTRNYYDTMVRTARWGQFDVLAHLTLPLRYVKGRDGVADFTLDPYEEMIQETLRILAREGKGIEINTSGLRQQIGLPMPTLPYLKRFRQLGGEIVTLGSDSHNARDIAAGFEAAAQILREAGFGYFAYFQERKPVMVPLD